MTEQTELPKFASPPVAEVALSVIVEPITALRAAHIGLLWQDLRTRFPKTVDQPPLDSPTEVETEPRTPVVPMLQFEPIPTLPLRTWFLNDAESELLQIQQDRVARNWRRVLGSESYPSYENIRGPFREDVSLVAKFFADNKLGELKPKQAEVSYVNHIVAGEGWKGHTDLSRVFTTWKDPKTTFLPPIADGRFACRYVIRHRGNFAGRLHVAMQPAFRQTDGKDVEIFVLTLTARGAPLGKAMDDAFSFLDLGHEWIVNAFAELTTPEMHHVWKRQP